MKKNHHLKKSTKFNKLVALLILLLCASIYMMTGDLTATIFMLPIALVLFFVKTPIIGHHEEEDYPWGGKK